MNVNEIINILSESGPVKLRLQHIYLIRHLSFKSERGKVNFQDFRDSELLSGNYLVSLNCLGDRSEVLVKNLDSGEEGFYQKTQYSTGHLDGTLINELE